MDIWDGFLVMLLLPWLWRATYFIRLTHAALRFTSHTGSESKPLRFTVLIPAHNEAACIAKTLHSLQAMDYPESDRQILVIADNCTDDTAKIAKSCGADVLQRFDETKRGKGYALEYAIAEMHRNGEIPDAVVVIDADTLVDRNMLSLFAQKISQGCEFMQAYYTVANPDDSWRTKLMTYALGLFNGVWLMGLLQIGLGATLRGNGMCFTWQGLRDCPLRSYGLAEDMEYSWYLRLAGKKVEFVPQTRVYGEMVRDAKAAVSQRQRWESGRKVLRQQFHRLIMQTEHGGQRLLMLSELYMWPLGRLLFWTFCAGLLILLKLWVKGASILGVGFLGFFLVFLLTLACYASLPFIKLNLPLKYLWALFHAPYYFLWKLSLLWKKGPKSWVRTERNDGN